MKLSHEDRWVEYRLQADERPRVLYEYYVTGKMQFPFDMLRYDAAWPASGEDAARMDLPHDAEGMRKMRSVRLRSHHPPTIDRWSSFLWSVGQEKIND